MRRVTFAARSGKTVNTLLLLSMMLALMPAGGIGAARAESPYAIRDHKVDPKLPPAARARLLRAEAIKKKHDLKKVVEQQVAAEQAAAPGPKNKGGAK
jgi:hypothetical protein